MNDNHDHHEFERNYWGNCVNTFDEENKQYVYARLMGLEPWGPFAFDVHNKSIIDVGGGPVSLLLKCINLKHGLVIDPIEYPDWTVMRYSCKNVAVSVTKGEDLTLTGYDECWIYNCLQHVEDPKKIIDNAKKAAHTIRIFEWIDIPPHDGHPHELNKQSLDSWFNIPNQSGQVIQLNERGCVGKAYYGVFKSLQQTFVESPL